MEGEPLLVKVMEKGKLNYNLPSLNEIRAKAAENLSKLPEEFKALTNAPVYPVELSQKLQDLVETTKLQLTKNEINNGALKGHSESFCCIVFCIRRSSCFRHVDMR